MLSTLFDNKDERMCFRSYYNKHSNSKNNSGNDPKRSVRTTGWLLQPIMHDEARHAAQQASARYRMQLIPPLIDDNNDGNNDDTNHNNNGGKRTMTADDVDAQPLPPFVAPMRIVPMFNNNTDNNTDNLNNNNNNTDNNNNNNNNNTDNDNKQSTINDVMDEQDDGFGDICRLLNRVDPLDFEVEAARWQTIVEQNYVVPVMSSACLYLLLLQLINIVINIDFFFCSM
jgi:hypothetical protein